MNKKPDPFADLDPDDDSGFNEAAFSKRVEKLRAEKTKKERDAKRTREEPKLKQADILIAIAKRGVLFHNHEGVAYADIAVGGHRETWPVRSTGYRRWLLAAKTAPSRGILRWRTIAPSIEACRVLLLLS